MGDGDRHSQMLRLPRDIAKQLHEEAQRQHISANLYVQMAVKRQLAEDRDQRRERQADRRALRDRDSEAPRGLGLRLRPLSMPEAEVPIPVADPPAAPVTINVGTPGTASGESGPIGALVDFVINGPAFSREQRKRTAVEVLKAHGRTGEEREALARRLDAALAERLKQQPNGLAGLRSVAGGWFGR